MVIFKCQKDWLVYDGYHFSMKQNPCLTPEKYLGTIHTHQWRISFVSTQYSSVNGKKKLLWIRLTPSHIHTCPAQFRVSTPFYIHIVSTDFFKCITGAVSLSRRMHNELHKELVWIHLILHDYFLCTMYGQQSQTTYLEKKKSFHQ